MFPSWITSFVGMLYYNQSHCRSYGACHSENGRRFWKIPFTARTTHNQLYCSSYPLPTNRTLSGSINSCSPAKKVGKVAGTRYQATDAGLGTRGSWDHETRGTELPWILGIRLSAGRHRAPIIRLFNDSYHLHRPPRKDSPWRVSTFSYCLKIGNIFLKILPKDYSTV